MVHVRVTEMFDKITHTEVKNLEFSLEFFVLQLLMLMIGHWRNLFGLGASYTHS